MQKEITFGNRRLPITKLAPMCKQISFMLSAGIPIKSAIDVLAKTDKNLQHVLEGIMRGESFSQSLKYTGRFPVFMCNMCKIGEASDNLPKVMILLANYYEETLKNREEIKSALMYPAIVAIMMIAVVMAAILYILPSYALMFEASDVPLPTLTQSLLTVSHVLAARWFLLFLGIIAIIATTIALAHTAQGKSCYQFALLHIPPFSIVYRQSINLHIIQLLSILLQSGQPLGDAVLAVSEAIPNKQVAYDLQQIAAKLQEGNAFWGLLDTVSYIDKQTVSMAQVGEETGDMATIFEHASKYSQYQFAQMSQRLNKLVEPIVTLILGLLVGLIMLSILLPTFAMTEVIG